MECMKWWHDGAEQLVSINLSKHCQEQYSSIGMLEHDVIK